MTTSTPVKAETAIAYAIGDLLTARVAIARALTDRGLYYGKRPQTSEEADLSEIYNRLSDLLAYCERKIKPNA